MIQNSLVALIIAAVVVKIGYNLWKALSSKETGLCGGCASCDFKRELKKRGKLHPVDPAGYFKVDRDRVQAVSKSHLT